MTKSKETPCGEQEEQWSVYKQPDPNDKHYSEKGDHQKRTIGNDERPTGHRSFFKKKKGGWNE